MLHLGDYLYEYGPGEYGYGQDNVDVRPHDPPREMVGLADYRRRHAQYKTDPDLQDQDPPSNPILGNHGHPVTRPIPFFLAGGHPTVPHGTSHGRARTTDVAPTLTRFFGVGGPKGGYDGRNRLPR